MCVCVFLYSYTRVDFIRYIVQVTLRNLPSGKAIRPGEGIATSPGARFQSTRWHSVPRIASALGRKSVNRSKLVYFSSRDRSPDGVLLPSPPIEEALALVSDKLLARATRGVLALSADS